MEEEQQTTAGRDKARARSEAEQKAEADNRNIVQRLLAWIREVFSGRRNSGEPSNKSGGGGGTDKQQNLIDFLDQLDDKGDELNQEVANTLSDLAKQRPEAPTSDDPSDWKAYQTALTEHKAAIDSVSSDYSKRAEGLQGQRDAGIKSAEKQKVKMPPSLTTLDAKLGADGEGPLHADIAQVSFDIDKALAEASETIDSLESQTPTLATPVPDLADDKIVRGKEARLAIGRRMLEIAEQGAQENGQVRLDQTAFNKELDRLMPQKESGMLGTKDQHEQAANLAFANKMTAV